MSFISLAALTSCGGRHTEQTASEYPVLEVKTSEYSFTESHSATIEGRQDIELYAQVSGTISQLKVREGQQVRKGQVLFVIDQVPYRAALNTARAAVQAAEASVQTARLEYDSKKELFREKVVSQYDLSLAGNNLAVAEASLEQAKTAEVNAANNLSYTEVKSPSDGVIGTLPYRVGALVGPSSPTPLTTVSDNSEVYVYFSLTEKQILALLREYGSPAEIIDKFPEVELMLSDGNEYSEKGKIETISGVINPQTGTVSVRCVFPNKNQMLLSGSTGKVMIESRENVITIPQSCAYELQDKVFAFKVADGKAIATEIVVDSRNDGKNFVVREGLSDGDIIISEGVGLLRDGQQVKIKGE